MFTLDQGVQSQSLVSIKVAIGGVIRKIGVKRGSVLKSIRVAAKIDRPCFVYVDEDGEKISAETEEGIGEAVFVDGIIRLEIRDLPRRNASDDIVKSPVPSKKRITNEIPESPQPGPSYADESFDGAGDIVDHNDDSQDYDDGDDHDDDHDAAAEQASKPKSGLPKKTSVAEIRAALSEFHERGFGSKLELIHRKEKDIDFLTCTVCDTDLDISSNWRNVKKHFHQVNHKMNFYAVYGREENNVITASIGLNEIQAQCFIETEARNKVKLRQKDRRPVISCLSCPQSEFSLSGRPSFQHRVREHLRSRKHKNVRLIGNEKYQQKIMFSYMKARSAANVTGIPEKQLDISK